MPSRELRDLRVAVMTLKDTNIVMKPAAADIALRYLLAWAEEVERRLTTMEERRCQDLTPSD